VHKFDICLQGAFLNVEWERVARQHRCILRGGNLLGRLIVLANTHVYVLDKLGGEGRKVHQQVLLALQIVKF